MGNRKRSLIGSRKIGKLKPERGSDGNRNLKIGGYLRSGWVWIDGPRMTLCFGKAPFTENKCPDLEHSPHICASRFLALQS